MAGKRDIDRLSPKAAMDYENGFYWFSSPNRIAKLCAHYELYKLIVNLPGEVVESGVFKASSSFVLQRFVTSSKFRLPGGFTLLTRSDLFPQTPRPVLRISTTLQPTMKISDKVCMSLMSKRY